MQESNLDICILMDRENLIYYSGLQQVECMGIVVPREGAPEGVTLWLDLPWIRENCALEKIRGYQFPVKSVGDALVDTIKGYGNPDPAIGFERYFVSLPVYQTLRNHFSSENFVSAAEIIYRQRAVKAPDEIGKIKMAGRAVCAGIKAAVAAVKPGIQELDLVAEAEYASIKAGSQGAPFRPQIVSGKKTLLTHPFSDTKKIQEGEIVLIHIGARYEGYTAKLCRTVAVGAIPEEQKKIYSILRKAQDACLSAMKPGVPVSQVYEAARSVIEANGYGQHFLDVIGYGVGLRQSEFYPIIGKSIHYPLEANMVVDVLLPSIYKPVVGGPRLTDTIWIRENGPEILTDYPRDMIQV